MYSESSGKPLSCTFPNLVSVKHDIFHFRTWCLSNFQNTTFSISKLDVYQIRHFPFPNLILSYKIFPFQTWCCQTVKLSNMTFFISKLGVCQIRHPNLSFYQIRCFLFLNGVINIFTNHIYIGPIPILNVVRIIHQAGSIK